MTWASEETPDIVKIPEVLTSNIEDSNILHKKLLWPLVRDWVLIPGLEI